MADEIKIEQAKKVYVNMCAALTVKGWNFKRFDDDLAISLSARGDDIPIDVVMQVNAKSQVVTLFSPIKFDIPEDKRLDLAVAVCISNYGLVNGSFDYDISDGDLRFRLTTSYIESSLGDELFNYMLLVSAGTVDKYNDKFLSLAKGLIDLEKFIELEKQN